MRQPEDVGFRHGWLFAPSREAPGMVVCVGGACVDRSFDVRGKIESSSSNPARCIRGFGGVARNVAENLGRLGVEVSLITVVGHDDAGVQLLHDLKSAGVNSALVKRTNGATDEYVAILEAGELYVGAADLRALESFAIVDLDTRWEHIAQAEWLFLDFNVSADILQACIQRRAIAGYKLAVDAVSVPKVRNLPSNISAIDLLFMNAAEARAYLGPEAPREPERLIAQLQAHGAQQVIVSSGAKGVVCADRDRVVSIPSPVARVINATGAGDALCAGTLSRLVKGEDLFSAARFGVSRAAQTVQSERTVVMG